MGVISLYCDKYYVTKNGVMMVNTIFCRNKFELFFFIKFAEDVIRIFCGNIACWYDQREKRSVKLA